MGRGASCAGRKTAGLHSELGHFLARRLESVSELPGIYRTS